MQFLRIQILVKKVNMTLRVEALVADEYHVAKRDGTTGCYSPLGS